MLDETLQCRLRITAGVFNVACSPIKEPHIWRRLLLHDRGTGAVTSWLRESPRNLLTLLRVPAPFIRGSGALAALCNGPTVRCWPSCGRCSTTPRTPLAKGGRRTPGRWKRRATHRCIFDYRGALFRVHLASESTPRVALLTASHYSLATLSARSG